jgi:hypothetical protein
MKSKYIVLIVSCILLSFVNQQTVNEKIITYCNNNLNKKIDRGECWDLANRALEYAGAKWSPPYVFGTPYNYKKGTILEGDLIQFEKVVFKTNSSKNVMPHHTAIVYKVHPNLVLELIHQNVNGSKKVQITTINFKTLAKGKIQFFRPQ